MGVIGCGEIAQIMHLPYLSELPQFTLEALCDLSRETVDAMGERYNVSHRFTDYTDLVAIEEIDIVAILTLDHYDAARAAIAAGKHVFVEKPLCFSVEEGTELVALAKEAGVLIMVGYMKCFDPGFEYAVSYIGGLHDVRLIHIQDFTGVFDAHHSLYDIVRPTDIPADTACQYRSRVQSSIQATLGPSLSHHADLFRKLLMLGSHDLAVLRMALGSPQTVLFSNLTHDWGITSLLDYGEGRRCLVEIGSWPKYQWFHERIVAYGRDEIVTVAFSSPYAKNKPSTVQIEKADVGDYTRSTIEISNEEPFKREWVHFAQCIASGRLPRTDGAGAVQDIELARELIRALP